MADNPYGDLSNVRFVPVDHDPFAYRNSPEFQAAHGSDTLAAPDPSWRESAHGMVEGGLERIGASRSTQQTVADRLVGSPLGNNLVGSAVDWMPGASNALFGNEAYRSYQRGDYPGAVMSGIAAFPWGPAIGTGRGLASRMAGIEPGIENVGGKWVARLRDGSRYPVSNYPTDAQLEPTMAKPSIAINPPQADDAAAYQPRYEGLPPVANAPANVNRPSILPSPLNAADMPNALERFRVTQPGPALPQNESYPGINVFHGSPHQFPAETIVDFAGGQRLRLPMGSPLPPEAAQAVQSGNAVVRDFPLGAFDTSKIGTGEGSQAQGRGLYTAEREDVAKNYREVLAGKSKGLSAMLDGQENWYLNPDLNARAGMNELWGRVSPYQINSKEDATRIMARVKTDLENTIKNIDTKAISVTPYEDNDYRQALGLLNSGRVQFHPPVSPGATYQARIYADPSHFLDWDKPLAEQSGHVKHVLSRIAADRPYQLQWSYIMPRGGESGWALHEVGEDPNKVTNLAVIHPRGNAGFHVQSDSLDTTVPIANGNDEAAFAEAQRLAVKKVGAIKHAFADNISGSEIHSRLANHLGDTGAVENLRDAGIKGIRYLDAQSRHTGQGTHNYVVFDDRIMDILRRYGIAGLGLGGAAIGAGILGSQQPAQAAPQYRLMPVDHDPFAPQ